MNNRLFFLDQHGCAKNQVDGELIIGRLNNLGWKRSENAEDASLIIVNSCGFINSAKTESINSLIQAKNAYPNAKVLLAGCLAERYFEEFMVSLPEADAFLGNGDLSLLDKCIEDLFNNKRKAYIAEQKGVCCGHRPELLNFSGSAYVKITEGCNNRCSFCAIPLIRGNLRSRKIEEIIEEIKELLARGVKEINLIGQDLASFGKDFENLLLDTKNENIKNENVAKTAETAKLPKSWLAILLEEIKKIAGDFWLRLLYIHPDNFPLDILPIIASDNRILPYFDVPFQSGDDEIILKMNRKGNAQKYIELIKNIRTILPNAVLRTTFLCGFPGEKEENFKNTKEFLTQIEPDWSGCFDYSAEENTPAFDFPKKVSSRKAKKRCEELIQMQEEITQKKLQRHLNKKHSVIIEEIVPIKEGEETGFVIGRSWFQAPEVDGATVIRYDATSEEQCKKIAVGEKILAQITGSRGVDIEGFML